MGVYSSFYYGTCCPQIRELGLGETAPPQLDIEGTAFISTQHNSFFLVAACDRHAELSLIQLYLFERLRILGQYLKKSVIDDATLLANLSLVDDIFSERELKPPPTNSTRMGSSNKSDNSSPSSFSRTAIDADFPDPTYKHQSVPREVISAKVTEHEAAVLDRDQPLLGSVRTSGPCSGPAGAGFTSNGDKNASQKASGSSISSSSRLGGPEMDSLEQLRLQRLNQADYASSGGGERGRGGGRSPMEPHQHRTLSLSVDSAEGAFGSIDLDASTPTAGAPLGAKKDTEFQRGGDDQNGDADAGAGAGAGAGAASPQYGRIFSVAADNMPADKPMGASDESPGLLNRDDRRSLEVEIVCAEMAHSESADPDSALAPDEKLHPFTMDKRFDVHMQWVDGRESNNTSSYMKSNGSGNAKLGLWSLDPELRPRKPRARAPETSDVAAAELDPLPVRPESPILKQVAGVTDSVATTPTGLAEPTAVASSGEADARPAEQNNHKQEDGAGAVAGAEAAVAKVLADQQAVIEEEARARGEARLRAEAEANAATAAEAQERAIAEAKAEIEERSRGEAAASKEQVELSSDGRADTEENDDFLADLDAVLGADKSAKAANFEDISTSSESKLNDTPYTAQSKLSKEEEEKEEEEKREIQERFTKLRRQSAAQEQEYIAAAEQMQKRQEEERLAEEKRQEELQERKRKEEILQAAISRQIERDSAAAAVPSLDLTTASGEEDDGLTVGSIGSLGSVGSGRSARHQGVGGGSTGESSSSSSRRRSARGDKGLGRDHSDAHSARSARSARSPKAKPHAQVSSRSPRFGGSGSGSGCGGDIKLNGQPHAELSASHSPRPNPSGVARAPPAAAALGGSSGSSGAASPVPAAENVVTWSDHNHVPHTQPASELLTAAAVATIQRANASAGISPRPCPSIRADTGHHEPSSASSASSASSTSSGSDEHNPSSKPDSKLDKPDILADIEALVAGSKSDWTVEQHKSSAKHDDFKAKESSSHGPAGSGQTDGPLDWDTIDRDNFAAAVSKHSPRRGNKQTQRKDDSKQMGHSVSNNSNNNSSVSYGIRGSGGHLYNPGDSADDMSMASSKSEITLNSTGAQSRRCGKPRRQLSPKLTHSPLKLLRPHLVVVKGNDLMAAASARAHEFEPKHDVEFKDLHDNRGSLNKTFGAPAVAPSSSAAGPTASAFSTPDRKRIGSRGGSRGGVYNRATPGAPATGGNSDWGTPGSTASPARPLAMQSFLNMKEMLPTSSFDDFLHEVQSHDVIDKKYGWSGTGSVVPSSSLGASGSASLAQFNGSPLARNISSPYYGPNDSPVKRFY